MPRKAKPARLWLRPADAGRAAAWFILDRGKQIGTGCSVGEREKAERALQSYLLGKHDPSNVATRRSDQTQISDVLKVYIDEVVPMQASPKKVASRVERLIIWWQGMVLSEVTAATCDEYVRDRNSADRIVRTRKKIDGTATEIVVAPTKLRRGGGARRDLEDLRAAINHHAKRELHTGFVAVSLPDRGKPRPKYLTRAEVAKLLWVCWRHKRMQVPPRGSRKGQTVESAAFHDLRHLARFILMGVYTGSRTAPILKASICAASGRAFLDLEAELYHRLPEDAIESGNKRSPTSRLSPRLLAHVRRWRDLGVIREFVVEWNALPVASIKTAWAQATKLAGITGATPHTLRHTAVTWLKQQGFSSFDVAGYVGMSERMVEQVYGKHDPNFQRDIARGIGFRKRA